MKYGEENDKIPNMSERGISVTIDENDRGFVAKINRGGTCRMEVPISPEASPKEISEILVTEGAHLKYDRNLIRLGDLLMTAADKVPGLTFEDDYWQNIESRENIFHSSNVRNNHISSVGIINADSNNNSESDWDEGAMPEVVRY